MPIPPPRLPASAQTSMLPTWRHGWGTLCCMVVTHWGRVAVTELGSWCCSGDSTALQDTGHHGHLRPLLPSSPGKPASCVPWQGCQAAAGSDRVGWGWESCLCLVPQVKSWVQRGVGLGPVRFCPLSLNLVGFEGVALGCWQWMPHSQGSQACAVHQLALHLQQTEQ